MSDAASKAAMAAAMAAIQRTFNTQLWTFYAFGVLTTILRTYARIKAVGIKGLRGDDYIIWLAIALYTTQSTLAYFAVNYGQGIANNSMTDAQRTSLSPESMEYELRVFGSKVQVAGWTCYVCLIFTLKNAVLVFYTRLMEGLSRNYQMRIWIGFGLVGATFVASILVLFTACHPFPKYWQINPDPGTVCQAAVSEEIVWVTFISSVITDIYLIFVPLPMLWGTKLKLVKKIGATIVLGAGVFVLVCSLLKTIFVMTDPVNGAQLAGEWGTREAFVSVITTNLPMLFPLFKAWLKPLFGSALNSTQTPSNKHPSGFRTIGGGDGISEATARTRRTAPSVHFSGNLSITESEERIVKEYNMQDFKTGLEGQKKEGIVVSSEFKVTQSRVDSRTPEGTVQRTDSW